MVLGLDWETTLNYTWTATCLRKLRGVSALGNPGFQRAWAWGIKVKGVWDPSAGHSTIASIASLLCHRTRMPGQRSSREKLRSTLQHGGTPYTR